MDGPFSGETDLTGSDPGSSGGVQYHEGLHYVALDQAVHTSDPSRIELAVLFSYSDRNSFSLEPMLQRWAIRQDADVYVERVHSMRTPQMEPLSRGYYTSVVLNINPMTQLPAFKTFHVDHRYLNTPQLWAEFFANHGIQKSRTLSTYDSFIVTSMMRQAELREVFYRGTETPALIVNGKYRIDAHLLDGDHLEMLRVADYLINLERHQ